MSTYVYEVHFHIVTLML